MSRHATLLMTALLAALVAVSGAGCASSGGGDSGRSVEIVVTGTDQVSEGALLTGARRELAAFTAQGYRTADAADAAYSMERTLREAGHARGSVSFEMAPSEERPERVTYVVEEGPQLYLGSVTFPGRSALPEERLQAYFRFRGTGLLRSGAPLYRLAAVDAAIADIEGEYALAGYLDARAGPPKVTWPEESALVDVAIPIVEGPRYTVSAVEVTGVIPAEVSGEIATALDLVGKPFHRRLPVEAAGAVRRRLLARGHQRARVAGRAVLTEGAPTARILLEVEAGPVVRVGKVEVEGRDRTRSAFVRERVPLETGDPIDQGVLDEALSDLYASGVFKTVRMTLRPSKEAPDDPTVSDLVVEVEELLARSVEFQVGWGSYERLRGSAAYVDRNLAGTGRVLDLRTGASLKSARVHGRITDPHILGPGYSVQLGSGFERREEPSFDSRAAEFDATVRRTLSKRDQLLFGYSFRAEDAQNVDGGVRGAEDDGFVRTAGFFTRFIRDARDDTLFPTSGHVGELGLFWSSPPFGADLDFLETRARASQFFALGEGTVLALGAELTVRKILDNRTTLPIQERLFSGGENSVRSFQESELGPSTVSREPTGGLTSAEAHVELRQRLAGDLDAALFYDVGTVGRRSWSFSEGAGAGIGAGLRYRLPVGPIRLDYAYNPGDRFAANQGWAIHISFGFSF